MPHLGITVAVAALLSAILAVTGDCPLRERMYHAIYAFSASLLAVIAGSWLMYFIET